jgi:hypothetical protein
VFRKYNISGRPKAKKILQEIQDRFRHLQVSYLGIYPSSNEVPY